MIRALLVDDEAAFLKLAVMFLEEQEDILCDTARSATEALIRLQETPCDVVISDYEMPGLDGIAFLKQVRERWWLWLQRRRLSRHPPRRWRG